MNLKSGILKLSIIFMLILLMIPVATAMDSEDAFYIEYDYPDFHLSMDCFWAEVVEGRLVLKEAEAAKWLTKSELDSVKWLPADLELVEKIKEEWN